MVRITKQVMNTISQRLFRIGKFSCFFHPYQMPPSSCTFLKQENEFNFSILCGKESKFTNSCAKILTGELVFSSGSSFCAPGFFMLLRVDCLLNPFVKDSSNSGSDSLFLSLSTFSSSDDGTSASIA